MPGHIPTDVVITFTSGTETAAITIPKEVIEFLKEEATVDEMRDLLFGSLKNLLRQRGLERLSGELASNLGQQIAKIAKAD